MAIRTVTLFSALAPIVLMASSLHAALPDAPAPAVTAGRALFPNTPCWISNSTKLNSRRGGDRDPCLASPKPEARFLDGNVSFPLTPEQKAHLAVRDLTDPGNFATVLGTAGFTIGTNSHTAYGPGWTGFGRNVGYSFLQEATFETFGTFLIPSVTRQDPRYHRIPGASIPHRALHALASTVIAQSDSGHAIPNYANLLAVPISTEISNLYVPGVHGNGPSTVARILTGYTTTPADNLITEFLPDVARHLHIRVIFVQRILNQVGHDEYVLP